MMNYACCSFFMAMMICANSIRLALSGSGGIELMQRVP